MKKDDIIQQLQEAVGSEDPLFLSPSEIAMLSADELPEDVMLSIGQIKKGVIHVEWDGHFFKEGRELKAYCQYIWTRKYWDEPLGMPFYLDLVKRSIETREKTKKDVRFLSWDDDGAFIHLSYECIDLPDSLSDAYDEVIKRQNWLEEAAESVSRNAGIFASGTAQKLSGWGSSSPEELVNIVETAKTTDDKGRSLEELVARLFAAIPGFTVSGRVRTETEEIDISILNSSPDPRFIREEALILVECKNWTSKCGKNEFVLFKGKMENRKGRCSLGFLVSWNGFKETVTKEMLRGSHERVLIVPIDGLQIRKAVRENGFGDCIIRAWEEAINT
jgi:hypothetical protein